MMFYLIFSLKIIHSFAFQHHHYQYHDSSPNDIALLELEKPLKFNQKIKEILIEANAQIGVGGYGEIRPFYTTDAYEIEGNNGPQWRTVLGPGPAHGGAGLGGLQIAALCQPGPRGDVRFRAAGYR